MCWNSTHLFNVVQIAAQMKMFKIQLNCWFKNPKLVKSESNRWRCSWSKVVRLAAVSLDMMSWSEGSPDSILRINVEWLAKWAGDPSDQFKPQICLASLSTPPWEVRAFKMSDQPPLLEHERSSILRGTSKLDILRQGGVIFSNYIIDNP